MLRPGIRLGPYEVLAPLGAGGMGEVWRGRDTRLDRAVAIKVLPAALAADPERRARFEREARAASRLGHPNICALYDIGREDTAEGPVDYMVMELLDGESLADRLKRGPLPLAQAVRHGIEVADALDKAHREGVVHRDLKPGNVVLTKAGARLLDFGLAKLAAEAPGGASVLSALPTEQAPLTAEGTILGTLAYMAPEVLEGKAADARSDIFAFGALLHEMVTGRRAFAGKSQASLIAAILQGEVTPVSRLAPLAPPALEHLVSVCLAKDPDDRWQSARDLTRELKRVLEAGTARGERATPPLLARIRGLLPWVLAGALGVSTALLLANRYSGSRGEGIAAGHGVVRFEVPAPADTAFCSIGRDAGPVAVSPAGTLAFVATARDGGRSIFVRSLDDLAARPLAGTEGASYPFWSADGRQIGFFADGKLRKVAAAGGPVQTICDAPFGRGGTWNRDGVIVFSPSVYSPLLRVSSAGGPPTPVTRVDDARGQISHRWPHFLPDGRRFLFLGFGTVPGDAGSVNAVYAGSLDSLDSRLVLPANSRVEYSPPGHLLFVREGTLLAAPFDERTATVKGEPVPVADGVQVYANTSSQAFSASATGVLAWHRQGQSLVSELVWFDRGGKRMGSLGPPGDYEDPALSPDGTRVAFARVEPLTGGISIWLSDLARGATTRFTFSSSFEHAPVWSPDASRIAFDTNRNGPTDVYQKSLRGGGDEQPLVRSPAADVPSDWSRDGRLLVFQRFDPATRFDIWVQPLSGNEPATPFRRTEANEVGGRLSPDGRFLAFASDESGRWEVHVAEFPGPGNRWQVSAEGGSQPRWRRDGRELFYLSARRELMAVAVRAEEASPVGPPRPLFRTGSRWTAFFLSSYDVTPDGQRFLVNSTVIEDDPPPISVILDWTRTLLR